MNSICMVQLGAGYHLEKLGFVQRELKLASGEITEKFFIRNIIGADEITSGWNLILNNFFNITRVCIFYINVNYRCRKIGRVILKINWNVHRITRHFKIRLNLIKLERNYYFEDRMIFDGKTIIRSAFGNLALANISSFIHVQLPVPEKKVIFYLKR